MKSCILISGAAGFIASHLVAYLLEKTNYHLILLDKLSYASCGLNRLRSLLSSERITFFTCDLCLPFTVGLKQEIKNIGSVDYIIHMAAETHVDNSIREPRDVIVNNVMSTVQLLEYTRLELPELKKFIHFSTDEVYGPAPIGTFFSETDRHNPTNPYSASKSAAEQICNSYHKCYGTPLITVNVMNVFGEMQHPEKFIPKVIQHVLENKLLNIHTDINNKPGTRTYIYGKDVADAVLFIVQKGVVGETYNLPGQMEMDNLALAKTIHSIVERNVRTKVIPPLRYLQTSIDLDRPNHDIRYGLAGEKIKQLGWGHKHFFMFAIEETVRWYLENNDWLELEK